MTNDLILYTLTGLGALYAADQVRHQVRHLIRVVLPFIKRKRE